MIRFKHAKMRCARRGSDSGEGGILDRQEYRRKPAEDCELLQWAKDAEAADGP